MKMESSAWTEERLDDLSQRMDAGFERVDRRMSEGFERVDTDIRELRGEIRGLNATMLRVGGAIMAGLVGVIAAVLITGG